MADAPRPVDNAQLRPLLGLLAGPLIAGGLLLVSPPEGLSDGAWAGAATAVLMMMWWVSEALPVAVTALVIAPWIAVAS